MSDKTRRIVGVSIIACAVLLAVVGYFTLPDTLVVQLAAGGTPANTLPKIPALLIPLAVSCIFAVLFMTCAAQARLKYLLVSLLGFAIDAVTFIVNR